MKLREIQRELLRVIEQLEKHPDRKSETKPFDGVFYIEGQDEPIKLPAGSTVEDIFRLSKQIEPK